MKWCFTLGIIAVVVMWATGYKVRGKTVEEYLDPYLKSKMAKEAMKDFRSIVGEGFKAAGEAISEDVTDNERKQLDDLVKQELMNGKPISGVKNQEALTPEVSPNAKTAEKRPNFTNMLPSAPPTTPGSAPAKVEENKKAATVTKQPDTKQTTKQ